MKSADLASLEALIETDNWIGSLGNISAQILSDMPRLNWVGFYLWDGKTLRLGPFAGRPACTQIPLGKGVCGTAAQKRQTLRVDNVDQFPGHIVCDLASKSELVVPWVQGDTLVGVLDVDSPELSRFGPEEQAFFENLISRLSQVLSLDAVLPLNAQAFRNPSQG